MFRYSKRWAETDEFGQTLTTVMKSKRAVPRIPGLYPGVTIQIPNIYPVELREACDNTAKYLISKYQILYVLWSGGVDSTLVASLLVKHRVKNQIILGVAGLDSIDISMIEKFASMGCQVCELDLQEMRNISNLNSGIVVTGYHGDSLLVGAPADQCDCMEDIFFMSPIDLLTKHLDVTNRDSERFIAGLEKLTSKNPFTLNAANFSWWLDFTTSWETESYDPMFRFGLAPPGIGYFNFFGSDDFQRWAFRPVEHKIHPSANCYKYQYQEIIDEIIGISPSRKNRSDLMVYPDAREIFNDKLIAILENYSIIRNSF